MSRVLHRLAECCFEARRSIASVFWVAETVSGKMKAKLRAENPIKIVLRRFDELPEAFEVGE
jgi:hypothetical protein